MVSSKPSSAHGDRLAEALQQKAQLGGTGTQDARTVAAGEGWRVADIVCTAGPGDRPYEERQALASLSFVLAGTFTYRSQRGSSLMSAGSCLLVDTDHPFECSHTHGDGDRCLSFQFEPALLEQIGRDAGVSRLGFQHDRVPPLRALAPLMARAQRAIEHPAFIEEVAFDIAATVLRLACTTRRSGKAPPIRHARRVAASLREMERRSAEPLSLRDLAAAAQLSPYHFLRTFKAVTGVTPHQWLLRARLRHAAHRLSATTDSVTEVALDVGFEDLSNFIRTFRAEFGVSPSRYKAGDGAEEMAAARSSR